MKVYGSLETIKKGISRRYQEMLKEEQKKALEQKKELKQEIEKQKQILEKEYREKALQVIAVEKSRILNEKRMDAKKEFEIEREKLIASVLREVEKKAEAMLGKKEYYELVNRSLSGKRVAVSSSLKGIKNKIKNVSKIKQEKGLKGIIAETNSEIFDFTIPSIVEEKKSLLRETIAKELFGEN